MSTNNQHRDRDDNSRWSRIFWSHYQELEASVKQLPDGGDTQLIPSGNARGPLLVAERNLKHAALMLNQLQEDVDEEWTKVVTTARTRYLDGAREVSEEYELSLASLAEWTPKPTIDQKSDGRRGMSQQKTNVAGHLPPRVLKQLFRQLNHVLAEIGWLPEAQSTSRTEISEELLEKVEEWRQNNQE